ncbi:hypothetical protein BDQ94DRAFT_146677 [Aspergillus welwitschiae]|uniref:Uncharacterized protein n=1 Tax=Aspergillus welwitschiae TaxID=1341132 RepID=A0A3F3PY72_9EURO|nr:hypothetical protein BDQ94DRAFT_146677 [Aspergillus welwitschiae]RDH31797.1 hypothetical protein BDQ94DRAFT_146677 [Aspergillus welwitschiae]
MLLLRPVCYCYSIWSSHGSSRTASSVSLSLSLGNTAICRHAETDLTEGSETSPEAENVIDCRPVKFRPNPW